MCTVLMPQVVNTIAVNKYIYIYLSLNATEVNLGLQRHNMFTDISLCI